MKRKKIKDGVPVIDFGNGYKKGWGLKSETKGFLVSN